jgi:hypothetical protein
MKSRKNSQRPKLPDNRDLNIAVRKSVEAQCLHTVEQVTPAQEISVLARRQAATRRLLQEFQPENIVEALERCDWNVQKMLQVMAEIGKNSDMPGKVRLAAVRATLDLLVQVMSFHGLLIRLQRTSQVIERTPATSAHNIRTPLEFNAGQALGSLPSPSSETREDITASCVIAPRGEYREFAPDKLIAGQVDDDDGIED